MPGFILIRGKFDNNIVNYQSSKYLVENLEYNDLFIQRRTIKKFLDDKVFKQNNEFLVVTEGVIFNKLELEKKYEKDNFFETIIEMYKKNGETFFNEFRGSFSGIFIDKKSNKKLIYTDHIGTKPIFYHNDNIIASDIKWIVEILRNNKKSYSFDQIGAYCLLTYGFMIDKMTLIKEVKRLLAGNYIILENTNQDIKEYFKLENIPNTEEKDEEIVENIDKLFKQAIEREVSKNYEYGYEDLAPLSAGLDSRMTVFGLSKNKKTNNLLTFTYSESNYFDEKTPKKIADDLRINWMFKSLDNGLNLFLLEKVIEINNGLCLYIGGAQVLDMFQNINIDKKGIIHTGMLGDATVGTYQEKLKKDSFKIGDGAYSKKLITKLERNLNLEDMKKYSNQELFKMNIRGFLGMNMGSPIIFQDSLESFSPFYDLEFISYCLTIPVEKRFGHYIYDKWILSKYPEASKYLHNGKRKIGDKTIEILGRNIPRREVFNKILKFILRKLKIIKNDLETRHHMNPVDYWYNTNNKLKLYFDNYYEENLKLLKKDVELKKDMEFLYNTGTSIEKTQVLSLLAAIKLYFDEV